MHHAPTLRSALRLGAAALLIFLAAVAAPGLMAKGKEKKEGVKGPHCLVVKGVTREIWPTENGAAVVFKGEGEAAVEHIRAHLRAHTAGSTCPGCPLSAAGALVEVNVMPDGGTLTAVGTSPEAVKAIQDWAARPHGQCCPAEGPAAAETPPAETAEPEEPSEGS